MNASGGVPVCAMKQEWHVWKVMHGGFATNTVSNTWSCNGNMIIWCVSYERNGGNLHGNISRNGYGNAMIGRYGGCFEEQYGGCFEEGYIVCLWHRRKLRGTREASNGGRVRVCIIHGLNISHKNSYTYCRNWRVIKTKQSTHAPRGEVGRS